jgi:hypothetical protein
MDIYRVEKEISDSGHIALQQNNPQTNSARLRSRNFGPANRPSFGNLAFLRLVVRAHKVRTPRFCGATRLQAKTADRFAHAR